MKRILFISMVLVLFSMGNVTSDAFGAKSLFDDFSGPYIDGEKWSYREYVQAVDPVAGKLVSKTGNPATAGKVYNTISFEEPESITAIECELTIVAISLDTGRAVSFARIEGDFYNTQFLGGAAGDILATVGIGDSGNGLQAFWNVSESLDDNLSEFEIIGSGTLIPPGRLTHGTAYKVKIAYDGKNGFEFTVDGERESFAGPERYRPAAVPVKRLTTATGTSSRTAFGRGYVSALFDDVYINNEATPYDTFDNGPLDEARWQESEIVKEVSDGQLVVNVEARDAVWGEGTYLNDDNPAYFEAEVIVRSGSWLSPGAHGTARIVGWYYNDSRGPDSGQDYNGYEGDVSADIWILMDYQNNLIAVANVGRVDNADRSLWTWLFRHEFSVPISFDTPHAISVEFTGSEFIFKCDNESTSYQVTTPTYEPYNKERAIGLETVVFAEPGESGYMKSAFDNVYTGDIGDTSDHDEDS